MAEKKEKKQKQPGKKLFNMNKVKRGGVTTLMTVVFIAIVIVLNVVVSALTQRFPSMDIDLTAEGLNTLSDQAMDVAKSVDEETTIYLIGSEEAYRDNQLYTDYGIEYSQVANLAERLQEANPLISVRFMDPDTNPDFISEHAEDYLVSGKVMVETEKRSRVLTVNDMFSLQQDQTTGMTVGYSMVDSALAGALEMVNLDEVPVLTIATGHDEILNSENLSGFLSLMEDQNFEVQEIDIMVDEIPEETQILMLPTPNTDYTDEEIQKLRDFVNDEEREEALTLLVTTLPNQAQLPKLAGFLEEWGVAVEPGVVAETDSSRVAVANGSYVLVDASEDMLEDGNYTRLVAPSSSPLSLLFSGNDGISTQALWTTADTAYVVTEDTTEEEAADPETSQQVVASHSYKYVTVGGNSVTRNVLVFGSSYVFLDTFLTSSAFDNQAYITDLLNTLAGTDGSSVTVTTEAVQTQTYDVEASLNTILILGLGVFTIGIPVVILAVGLGIFLKRRHL